MPFEVRTGRVTAAGATLTALVANSDDTFQVRDAVNPKLLNAWALTDPAAAQQMRIRSVLMHDNTQGIRMRTSQNNPVPLMPYGTYQPLQANDTLTVELTGSSTAGVFDEGAIMEHYDSLPGSEGRFIDEATLRERSIQPVSIENTISTPTTGIWGGTEALNAETDLLKSNFDYALVGYGSETVGLAVAWKGPDTGNLRAGGPLGTGAIAGGMSKEDMASWFVDISRYYGLPLIPVISAANRGSTNIEVVVDEGGADPLITTHLIQLTAEADKQAAATSAPTSRAGTETRRPVGTQAAGPSGFVGRRVGGSPTMVRRI